MNKRGQQAFGMSFGMIFSIILIIFIIGVAFYVITAFLQTGTCSQVGFVFSDFEEEVEHAWDASASGGRYNALYEGTVPSGVLNAGITYICFGSINAQNYANATRDQRIQQELIDDFFADDNPEHNMFLYPPHASCDLNSKKIACRNGRTDCLDVKDSTDQDLFFCTPVEDGTFELMLRGNIKVRASPS